MGDKANEETNMIHIKQAIIVEGKYDKMRLSPLTDALIIPVDGFRIFKNRDMLLLLRTLAERDGLLILTDSDQAGFKIRGYLKGAIPRGKIFHAYIPEIRGKERRKSRPGKEGLLGVEGMEEATLTEALKKAGCTDFSCSAPRTAVTKQDLYRLGLSGKAESRLHREEFCRREGFPTRLSANALLELINVLYSLEELEEKITDLPHFEDVPPKTP